MKLCTKKQILGPSKMKNSLQDIGHAIYAQRTFRRLSQVELAELAGVTFRPIHQIENGRSIRLETLIRICDVLGLDVDIKPRAPVVKS